LKPALILVICWTRSSRDLFW